MIKNAKYTFIGTIIYTAFLTLFQIILTHKLSPENYGAVITWLTSIAFLGVIMGLGLNFSALYFSRNMQEMNNIVTTNILIYTSILCIFVFLYFCNLLSVYVLFTGIGIYFTILLDSFLVTSQYEKNFFQYGLFLSLKSIVLFLTLVPITILSITDSLEVIEYILYGLLILIIFTGRMIYKSIELINIKLMFQFAYLKYGFNVILVTIAGQVIYVSDIFLIAYFLGNEQVSYYFIAVVIVKMAWFGVDSVGAVLYRQLLSKNDNTNLSINFIYFLSKISFTIELFLLFIFIIFGFNILDFFLDDVYMSSLSPIIILLLASHGAILYKLMNRIFVAEDNWKPLHRVLIISVVINIVLNILFINIFGISGAAIASFFSYWYLGLSLAFIKKLNLLDLFNVFTINEDIRKLKNND